MTEKHMHYFCSIALNSHNVKFAFTCIFWNGIL